MTLEKAGPKRTNLRAKASKMKRDAKHRSKKKGLPFNLTLDWIVEKLRRGVCERTGTPFVFESHNPRAPSLDQINPSKGYTMDNTQVVTWQYNFCKGQGTDEELLQFACDLVYHVERR